MIPSLTEYTLSASDLYSAAFLFSAILISVGVAGVKIYGKEPKKLAWIISLANSGLMTACGVYYIAFRIAATPNFLAMPAENVRMFESADDFTTLVCLWFALANIFDIALGLVYYRKYLGVLTAYVHHSVFIYVMFAATTGNSLFGMVKPFAPAFTAMTIEELPTFLLAVGSVFPSYRTDVGFGLTFFIFRLCYHVFFFFYAARVGAQTIELIMYTLTTLLHAHWFYNWITKYGSPSLKESQSRKSV